MTPFPLRDADDGSLNEAVATVPTRAEISLTDTWDLTVLFPDPAAWSAELESIKSIYPKITGFKGHLADSVEKLLEVLEFEKSLDLRLERLFHYASLQASEDSSNTEYLSRIAQAQNLYTLIGEACSFLSPELLAIHDDTYNQFIADSKLDAWKIRLAKVRRMKPHTLSEPEERLMALASSALHGHQETFSQLMNVDMKFGIVEDEKGKRVPLTQSSFSSFLVKRDPELRRSAFHQFYKEVEEHQYTMSSSLASSIRSDVFRARARHYGSALEAALFPDAVPVEIYHNLINAVRANLPALHRYYELRKKVLRLDQIHHYDTYVPLVADIQTDVGFDEAIDLVLGGLKPLGDEYVNTLAEGLKNGRWCDRYETKGKRSGAFSSGSYGNPPFILMNYKRDVFSDVFTLAHEAGHSMHTWYSQRQQSFQDYDYPIFLAEVASTFNEELLTHHLLEKTTDPAMRAYLINRQIDDIRGTMFRQTMFAEFELRAHAAEEEGNPPTLDRFRSIYRELLNAYFGPGFAIDQQLELECLRIPHFYSAFYVYKYATGISAAVSLSERVLNGGGKEVADYVGFLCSGGSRYPIETLQLAGVDMNTATPVEKTLELFSRRVSELESLLAPE